MPLGKIDFLKAKILLTNGEFYFLDNLLAITRIEDEERMKRARSKSEKEQWREQIKILDSILNKLKEFA